MNNAVKQPHFYQRFLRDVPREHGFEPLRIEGEIPKDLHGILYRNGPGKFAMNQQTYRHWFDGDGAVTAIRLNEGRAEGACRTIHSHWRQKEERAGKVLYRGYLEKGRGWRRWFFPKNPGNISVLPWQDRLFALWDFGMPIELDPHTLTTLGPTNLDRTIPWTFSAHPHQVGDAVYNFGTHYGPFFSLDLFRLTTTAEKIGNIPLPYPTLFHDFIATDDYLIFFCPPLRLRLSYLLTGIKSFKESLRWEPERGTEIIVVPLADIKNPVRFTVDAFFLWHFVNAWQENGELVVDFIRYPDHQIDQWYGSAPFGGATKAPPSSRYTRGRINLANRSMRTETLNDFSCEFPSPPPTTGKAHDSTWLISFDHGLSQDVIPSLVKFHINTGAIEQVPLAAHQFPSEAIFVPREQDNEGWILSLVYDADKDASFLAVIDGAKPTDGPIAKAWFDHSIPLSFHGAWKAGV